MLYSIVIPVYNSAKIISELCNQISDAMNGFEFEVVLVDDKSKDNSWDEIITVSSNSNLFMGISLAKNFGQHSAIMAGLSSTKGDYVIIMDDDLQHSPYDIPTLIKSIKENQVCFADLSNDLKQSWWKNVGSYFNSIQSEYIGEKPKGIYMSSFKILSRLVVESILEYKGPYPYIDGLICRTTSSINQVQIEHHKRFAGKGNYNLYRSISVFLKHTTGFSIFPLRLASIIGVILSLSGFFLGLYYIYQYFVIKDAPLGWTSLIVLELFIGGVVLFSLGIIGEYIGRIYLTTNKKPQFVIGRISNHNK
jgi:polyisoprenyl-phosphate glycosyltransferase